MNVRQQHNRGRTNVRLNDTPYKLFDRVNSVAERTSRGVVHIAMPLSFFKLHLF